VRPVFPTHLLNARPDAVIESKKHDHVLAMPRPAALQRSDELGKADVAIDVAVEAAGNDLAVDRTLHIGHFFRPLVDQQQRSA